MTKNRIQSPYDILKEEKRKEKKSKKHNELKNNNSNNNHDNHNIDLETITSGNIEPIHKRIIKYAGTTVSALALLGIATYAGITINNYLSENKQIMDTKILQLKKDLIKQRKEENNKLNTFAENVTKSVEVMSNVTKSVEVMANNISNLAELNSNTNSTIKSIESTINLQNNKIASLEERLNESKNAEIIKPINQDLSDKSIKRSVSNNPFGDFDASSYDTSIEEISCTSRPLIGEYMQNGKLIKEEYKDIQELVTPDGQTVAFSIDGETYSPNKFFKKEVLMGFPVLELPDGRQMIPTEGGFRVVEKDFVKVLNGESGEYLTMKNKILKDPNGDGKDILLRKIIKIKGDDGNVYDPKSYYQTHLDRILGSNRAPEYYSVKDVATAVANRRLREYKEDGTTILRKDDSYIMWLAGTLYLIQDAPFRFLDHDVHSFVKHNLDDENKVGNTINDIINIPFNVLHHVTGPITSCEYDTIMGGRDLVTSVYGSLAGKENVGYTILEDKGQTALNSGDPNSIIQSSESFVGGAGRTFLKYWGLFNLIGGGSGSSHHSASGSRSPVRHIHKGGVRGTFTYGGEFGNN